MVTRRALMRLQSLRLSIHLSRWFHLTQMGKVERVHEAHDLHLAEKDAVLHLQQIRAASSMVQRWRMQDVAKCLASWSKVVRLK
eukprot:COSAG01_NODE_64552_length_276_cov_0.581921_1_plen_83_part_01